MSSLVIHPLPPLMDEKSQVLLLGTMPSPKSREAGFYYAHPQNRFWRILSTLLDEPFPETIPERISLCHRHHIALWDVLHSCQIKGADDQSIREPKVNDLRPLLQQAPIQAIFTTGTKAFHLYKKHCLPMTHRPAVCLPSSSAANCRYHTLDTLVQAYRVILPYIEPI